MRAAGWMLPPIAIATACSIPSNPNKLSTTSQAISGTCSAPITITANGDQPAASTIGQPSSTDVDNSLSHNANDWTTDIGCSDVVYKLTGQGTNVTITTRPNGTDWAGVLYVRSASQGCSTDPYAAITDGSERTAGIDESVSFLAEAGVDYYITVADYGVASDGTCSSGGGFILNVTGLPGPGTCSSPIPITGNGDQAPASTSGRSSSTDVDNSLSHNANDWTTDIGCSDIVYSLVGQGTTVTLTTRPDGADWNGVLYVRSASQGCTTDAYAAITDGSEQSAGADESVSFFAESGVTYYVSVGAYGVSSQGTCSAGGGFILNVSGLPGSGSGTCASPIPITATGDQPSASIVGRSSSTDVDNPLSNNANDWTTDVGCSDIVYSLVGQGENVTITTRADGTDWGGVLYVRSASQGCTTDSQAPITDGSEQSAGVEESVSFLAETGVTYYISVGAFGVASQGTCVAGGSFILNYATGSGGGGGSGIKEYGQWANGTPPITAASQAGFDWFNTGYPGTATASDNATLTNAGVVPIAYINMGGANNSDQYLAGQIDAYFGGTDWKTITRCQVFGGQVNDVDVRDSRWQSWLIGRANDAYNEGNRGIFWDEAGIEDQCSNCNDASPCVPWDSTSKQQAIDALGSVMQQVHAAHPDMIQIVNHGYQLANQYTSLVNGYLTESILSYVEAHPNDSWGQQEIANTNQVKSFGIPIVEIDYWDNMGCSDTSCQAATNVINDATGYGWACYVTNVPMNQEGRTDTITPPWP